MAVPNELSVDAIRDFMLENGGKVTNHDLVKHFKRFLTDPETRVEARNQFKEYVNTVATIRNEEGEKYLVLKKKYRNPVEIQSPGRNVASPVSPSPSYDSLQSMSPSSAYPSSTFSVSQESLDVVSPSRMPPPPPPPYRAPPPPPPISPSSSEYASPPPPVRQNSVPIDEAERQNSVPNDETVRQNSVLSEDAISPRDVLRSPSRDESFEAETHEETVIHAPPPVPPRRKSTDKMKLENKENMPDGTVKRPKTTVSEAGSKDVTDGEDQKISVKERMLKFNRLATETDVKTPNTMAKKKIERGADDDDCASVTTLDAKSREWLVCASQANYHTLAKLATENPRLAKLKTALHWAAKHGNQEVVKLIAGTYGLDVNCRSNGGYTPLHMAMQFGHEEVYNLLVKVYNADPNLRDWSGRKPRQYQASQDTAVSADTFRKIKARKKQSEKDLGFLRIGSLNVRVKRTTEAFSNFLGVGHSSDKLHKTWGSADNIQQVDRRMMPPPKFAPIKKRRSKRAQDFALSHSTPSTPPSEPRRSSGEAADSDSDTACGFGSNWQSTV